MMSESSHEGRITEIREQVRDPERVSIFVDGTFRLGIPRILAAERSLHVGQVLTEDDLIELEALDEVSRATNQAIRLLSFRPRSRRELEDRLTRKGYEAPAVEQAISRLAEYGYIDDAEFAQYWIENRAQHRPRGKRMLASELRSKGVPQDVVDQALDDSELDEFGDALRLAEHRSRQLADLEPQVRRRRLISFLQRRGFNWGVVRDVLKEIDEPEGE